MAPKDSLLADLLTTDEAADLLELTAGTMKNYRLDKTGPPYVKIGGKVRYRRSDFESWITTIEPEAS